MKIYNLDEDTLLDEAEGSTQTEGMDSVRLSSTFRFKR